MQSPVFPGPQYWGIIDNNWYSENSFPDTMFATSPMVCQPTIGDPCMLQVESGFDKNGRGDLTLMFNPIGGFFPPMTPTQTSTPSPTPTASG
jgi:hypothetical protein